MIHQGDCLTVMRTMEPDSVDAIVCDPPYGLEFMGKDWDRFAGDVKDRNFKGFHLSQQRTRNVKCPECSKWAYDHPGRLCECGGIRRAQGNAFQTFMEAWATEALRAAKPGAHLVAFGGDRTFHRLTCAIEDAGWEIRTALCWLYGSGFPKSRNLDGEWSGWGTALKPGWEPIIMARKPLIGTVAANVTLHGTGALNIAGCRIGFASEGDEQESKGKNRHADFGSGARENKVFGADERTRAESGNYNAPGRWPANVVLSHTPECREVGTRKVKTEIAHKKNLDGRTYNQHGNWGLKAQPGEDKGYANADGTETVTDWACAENCPVRMLDEQSGEGHARGNRGASKGGGGMYGHGQCLNNFGSGDTGGASRFFYTAKASRAERSAGLGDLKATHPTVKPIALMRWLCRLVTPPNGKILDPFCGSGSTGCAAALEGFRFVGIEQDAEYCAIAEKRIAHCRQQPSLWDVA